MSAYSSFKQNQFTSPMKMLFAFLSRNKNTGIYALYHKGSKDARIYCSTNIVASLLRNIDDYKRQGLDPYEYEFHMLDENPDEVNVLFYTKKLTKLRYKVIHKQAPLEYRVVTRIQWFQGANRVFVLLRSKGRLYVTCGLFATMPEAKEFVEACLSGPIVRPVMAYNELTRAFFTE